MKNLIKKIAAAVTTVCVLCMIPLTSYAASEAAIASTEGRTRTRQDAEDLLRDMNDSTIHITIEQRGIFVENESILYGRKAIGVNDDGSFILRPWEVLFKDHDIPAGDDGDRVVSGSYVCFAYSVDIGWGTDWPFSRVFWYDEYSRISDLTIRVCGLPRLVNVHIWVNGVPYLSEYNCDSHNEWKP